MLLDPSAAAQGVRMRVYETIGSTNGEALALARAGERGPLWVVARQQTAGRGRRGRNWISLPGNLYASLLLTDPAPARRAAELSFVAALAVHDAVVDLATMLGPRLTLKWPNDLLCDGAKLAGILIEGEGEGTHLAVVIGIGVNCAHHPDDTSYPATDLAAAGALVSPDETMRALSRTMLTRLTQWDGGAGFAATRNDWLKRAAGRGERLRVVLRERELSGTFETLDEAGRLVLALADGRRETVTAADVFPLAEGAQ